MCCFVNEASGKVCYVKIVWFTEWISDLQSEFLIYQVNFWFTEWIYDLPSEFMIYRLNFWFTEWISELWREFLVAEWISHLQSEFLIYKVNFWFTEWISDLWSAFLIYGNDFRGLLWLWRFLCGCLDDGALYYKLELVTNEICTVVYYKSFRKHSVSSTNVIKLLKAQCAYCNILNAQYVFTAVLQSFSKLNIWMHLTELHWLYSMLGSWRVLFRCFAS